MYIITRGPGIMAGRDFIGWDDDDDRPCISRAVATLEEARKALRHSFPDFPSYFRAQSSIEELPESGGTIGPLPDGTVIEVKLDRDPIDAA